MKTKLFLLHILCIPFTVAFGQTGLYSNGTLKLSTSSDVLYISGNFTNASSSSLTNNGQLYVLGNLDNSEASMTAGTGTIYINGTSAQTINGTQAFKTYNLISNNSNGIILNNNLSVSGTHTFTSG